MKIIVDENMPFAENIFSRFGSVTKVKGRPFDKALLKDSDILLVRSVTKVDASLLENSSVKFVGTATAGTDHIDIQSLQERNIHFSSAAGCNAISVVEYVFSVMLMFAESDGFDLRDKCVGIVGVGNVGRRLAERLKAWGVNVLLCDPPRAKAEQDSKTNFDTFETLIKQADILTFHTPLIHGGEFNTFHLFDHLTMSEFADGKMIINASRGEVVDNIALLRALEQGRKWRVALDVWENEPDYSTQLLAHIDIGTAHIAGYSLEGKARGTTLLGTALMNYLTDINYSPMPNIENLLDSEKQIDLGHFLPIPDISEINFDGELTQRNLKRLIDLVYDVRVDDALFRLIDLNNKQAGFDQLRKNYATRREWSSLKIKCSDQATRSQLQALGLSVNK